MESSTKRQGTERKSQDEKQKIKSVDLKHYQCVYYNSLEKYYSS